MVFVYSPRLEISSSSIKLSFCSLEKPVVSKGSEVVLMSLVLARLEAMRGKLDSIPTLNSYFSISSSELQDLFSSGLLQPLQVQACFRH